MLLATLAFRTCRESEEKLLKQQNLALTLWMWRKNGRKNGNKKLVEDALMAFYGHREHENKLMAPIPIQKSSEVIFLFFFYGKQ